MQVKKASPTKKVLTTSNSKSKISPEKSKVNKSPPHKVTGKSFLAPQPTRDYFNYTPLRQNKSLTCSTPDLKANKSVRRDTPIQEIANQKKIILDQSKMLQEKLKEFKMKMKTNVLEKDFTKKISNSNRSIKVNEFGYLAETIQKLLKTSRKKKLQSTFVMISEIFWGVISESKMQYKKALKKKAFAGLKKFKDHEERAKTHYSLQLMVKSFMKWNEIISSEKSSTSIQTNDSIAENNAAKELSESGASRENVISELELLANQFYFSSLMHFVGIKPWKNYVKEKRYKNKLKVLANENYECKLMLKVFNLLRKCKAQSRDMPFNFRNATLMQKAFIAIKNSNKNEKMQVNCVAAKYHQVIFI